MQAEFTAGTWDGDLGPKIILSGTAADCADLVARLRASGHVSILLSGEAGALVISLRQGLTAFIAHDGSYAVNINDRAFPALLDILDRLASAPGDAYNFVELESLTGSTDGREDFFVVVEVLDSPSSSEGRCRAAGGEPPTAP